MTSHPPIWLMDFANKVAAHVMSFDNPGPIGCHYHFNDDDEQWEVSLFIGETEVVGGAFDGTTVASKFTLDIHRVCVLFSEITECYWQALTADPVEDDLGAHLSVVGSYNENSVWLRVLANAPRDVEPGREARPYVPEFSDRW